MRCAAGAFTQCACAATTAPVARWTEAEQVCVCARAHAWGAARGVREGRAREGWGVQRWAPKRPPNTGRAPYFRSRGSSIGVEEIGGGACGGDGARNTHLCWQRPRHDAHQGSGQRGLPHLVGKGARTLIAWKG